MFIAAFLHKRIHPSWLIAVIAFGILLGVASSLLLQTSLLASWEWLLFALLLLPIIFMRPVLCMLLVAFLSGLLIGLWRGSVQRVELGGYADFFNQEVVIRGTVTEDVPRQPNNALEIRIQEVKIADKQLPGQVWISALSPLDIKRSDIVTLSGVLRPGFGTFPGSMSYAKVEKVERPPGADPARDIRDTFTDGVRKGIPEPEASLGVGYLTGQRSTLPADFEEQLRIVGLTHVVVASGYNLTILVRFARRLFEKVSKYLAAASGGIMTSGFMLVTGFSPSMSRAGLVAGLGLLAWYYGRTVHPFVLLPFTAAITLLINPMYIWGDLGWYLSFLSFVGVIIFSPLVHDYFWGEKRPGVIRQTLIDTMSAQLITFPLLAFVFGEYSPYALLANLLVLPLIPLTMVLTFITGVAGLFLPSFALIAGLPAEFILSYMIYIVEWVANLPGAQTELPFTLIGMIVSYIIIFCIALFMQRKTKHNLRKESIVE